MKDRQQDTSQSEEQRIGSLAPPASAPVSMLASGSLAQRAAAARTLQRTAGNAATRAAISQSPRQKLSRFDPKHHRGALLTGLSGVKGWSSADLGAIYAANWERDLSQAHPAIGQLILAWKDVQRARADGVALEGPIKKFQTAMDRATDDKTLKAIASGEAYGGYRYYEHMDNPITKGMDPAVSAMLSAPVASGIPRYVADSRDEAIYQIVESVRAAGARVPAASRGMTERDAWAYQRAMRAGDVPASTTPLAAEAIPEEGRAAAEEAEAQARGMRGEGAARGGGRYARAVTEPLGRASHLLEDYFAHSNFVELAMGIPGFGTSLATSSFEMTDKMHALSHKLQSFIATMRLDPDLFERALGRRPASGEPGWLDRVDQFFSETQTAARLSILKGFAESLEHGSHAAASHLSHTHLAKDQPGEHHDFEERMKTIRFHAAQACAAEADRLVLGPLPGILDRPGQDVGADLDRIVETVHRVIAPPNDKHPCWGLLDPFRRQAQKALADKAEEDRKLEERLRNLDRFGPKY